MSAILLLTLVVGSSSPAPLAVWQAGTAKVSITPREPMWMAGYAARTKPSEGKIHDLWAKALAIEDPEGRRAVLVTLDLCGIGPEVSDAVRDVARAQHGIDRDRIVLACSHTHSGPVVGKNLIGMYGLDDEQRKRVETYTAALIESLNNLIVEALADLETADLAWGLGRADFAVNRRENKEADVATLRESLALKGPVDHDVPVLRVNDENGGLKAIVCGYACHCTVLEDNKFSGDYAGFAQVALEQAHPNTMALFVAGCGGDQNPIPRRTVELAQLYGAKLAGAVEDVLLGPVHHFEGGLASAYEEVPLKFASIPTKPQLDEDAKSKAVATAGRAKGLLARLEAKGSIDPTYPYPVQAWRIGELTWIFLGGEVVVDYSLRLKRNLGSTHTWVSAYCNDVMAYIPSARVLKEGGYEGGGAMLYYGQPSPWTDTVEDDVVAAVARVVKLLEPGR